VSYNKLILKQILSPPPLDGKQMSCGSMGCENNQTISYIDFPRPISHYLASSFSYQKINAQKEQDFYCFIQVCFKFSKFLPESARTAPRM